MPKNKKGKARAHFEEAPIPLAPPPPPGGRSPAPFQDGLDDDEFALPGSLLDGGGVHEDARNSPRATGWGNQPNSWAQGDDNGGDGWANGDEGDGGTEGDDGWGAKNGSNGGWGNNSDKGGDGWGNGKGRGGSGWDNESREQSGDGWADEWDGGSQRDQSWAQPAQRADPRHGLWQNRIASQTTTPRLKDMNFAPSGRSTRHPPGPTAAWQSWGQQAVPSAPPPPQPAPRSRAPAAQTRAPGWSNWAAEARGASQAGIVPSNAGGGWGNVQANPPPAVPAGGGWGSLPAQNSHVSLAPSHNAQHNAQYGRRADVGNQQRQILQGLLGRSFQQGFPPQQLNSPGRFHQAAQVSTPMGRARPPALPGLGRYNRRN
ncbi:hypothetical protein OE88DRAFT_673104 [Heliocybe sulcata]|uniref:Uncharacterized protein n=1 Tax=Heliocybe sulcata TaxID=5364 RepID=A0A5C3NQA7_9AGAM|nr:hypothetical protein OE88DRAFT_673104 [Heliocybe sulcata]